MFRILITFLFVLLLASVSYADTVLFGKEFSVRQNDCSGLVTDGIACWDIDDDVLYVGDGSSATQVGISAFTGLSDAPSSYSGEGGKYVKVNPGETALVFDSPAGSGDVTGVGDCASGDCLDGTSDGGTNVSLYDGNSNKLTLTYEDSAADITTTFSSHAGFVVTTDADTDDTVPLADGTGWTAAAIGDCDDSSGNHLNYDTATNAFSCGTSSSASDEVGTLTNGDLCVNDGSAVQCTVNTEAELETALDSLDVVTVTSDDITSANLATALSDETGTGSVTYSDSPTISTPTFSGKIAANGASVNDDDCTDEQGRFWYDDTDSAYEFCNSNSGTPTTLGGGNRVQSVYFAASGADVDGTQCTAASPLTINGGPVTGAINCADNDSSTIYGHVVIPDGWQVASDITIELEYVQTAADTSAMNSDIAIQCRGAGETVNNTWGTEIAIDDAAVSGSNAVDHTTSGTIDTNSGAGADDCTAGDSLWIRWQLDAAGTTTADATLYVLGWKVEYTTDGTD